MLSFGDWWLQHYDESGVIIITVSLQVDRAHLIRVLHIVHKELHSNNDW